MDPRDDDIEFDFFEDEPATTEAQPSARVRMPRRGGGRGPTFRRPPGPPAGLTPLLRLLSVIAIVIAVLVIFGLLIQSCASTSKTDAYKHYIDKVAVIAHSSTADGAAVAAALTTPGVKLSDLQSKLAGIAEQERQNVNAAEHLNPPGRLRDENEELVEALQYRVSGTQGLANAFGAGTAATKTSATSATLAGQAQRLLASDVIWQDSFIGPSRAVMQQQGVSGVAPPDSVYVTNPDLVSAHSMAAALARLGGSTTTGGGTPTGRHGTNLVGVKVLPSGKLLSPDTETFIRVPLNFGFVVTVHDGGDFQEVGIKVTLTIQQAKPIVETKTIDLINAGQDKSVTFSSLPSPSFANKTTVNIDIAGVKGEQILSNNKGSYPVVFSLPG